MYKNSKSKHLPVLLKESIAGLKIRKGDKYIDATVGDGGHALRILKKGGQLLAIDRDQEAVKRAERRLEKVYPACPEAKRRQPNRRACSFPQKPFALVAGNFKDLAKIAKKHGYENPSGVLFDLGVSSFQLEDPKKGLSFTIDAPLDMRLDSRLKRTAADLVNQLSQGELYEIFTRNAQEKLARPIAKAIVSARSLKPIETSRELSEIVIKASGKRRKRNKLHPATKVFLALRIEVNDEVGNLKRGLKQAIEILKKPKGRLAVISFHETEDRPVKLTMQKAKDQGKLKIITKKPIRPTEDEVKSNPRARSAKLRIAERL